jgi:hypothetical protein
MMQLVAMGAGNGGASEMPDALAVGADADGGSDANRFRAYVADQRALEADALQKVGGHGQRQDIGNRGSLSPERSC